MKETTDLQDIEGALQDSKEIAEESMPKPNLNDEESEKTIEFLKQEISSKNVTIETCQKDLAE